MAINDFSPIIQLMATLSIAFVAIEYVKSFTSQLCERVFRFKDFIAQSFKECKNSLADNETLNSLVPLKIEGKSTFTAIEEVKRKHETLSAEVETESKLKIQELKEVCQIRSMSALCLYIFLSCALILFLGGFEKEFTNFVRTAGTLFMVFSLIYLLCGWLYGERQKPFLKFCYFPSLRHTIIGFGIMSALTMLITYILCFKKIEFIYLDTVWNDILPLFILFICSNYVVFVVKIWKKAHQFRGNVNDAKEQMKEKCCAVKNEVDDLVAINRVSTRMRAD